MDFFGWYFGVNLRGGVRQVLKYWTAVDDKLHVIVAADVTTEETDYHQLIPMVEQVVHNTNHKPTVLSADPGYATYENYEFLNENGLNGLIPDNMHFIDTHGKPNLNSAENDH
jgi:hypothetical protein